MARSAPYTVQLDADVAQQLADHGGALLVLGLPEGSYFGIDHMAFRCGPRFRGIKMLPPGPHFVCYSVPGSEHRGGGMGPVTGFFFTIKAAPGKAAGEVSTANVIVRKYDAAEELLVELPDEEAQRYALGVRRYEFDWGLAPYNLHAWRQWKELTTCLDERIIDAIQPVGGNICTAAEAELDEQDGCGAGGVKGRPRTEAEARLRQQLLEGRAARKAAAAVPPPHSAPPTPAIPQGPSPPSPHRPAQEGWTSSLSDMKVEVEEGPHREVKREDGGGEGGGVLGRGTTHAAAAATASADDSTAAKTGGCGSDGGRMGSSSSSTSAGRCFYSVLPRLVKEAGLTAHQLTAINMDRSSQLEALAAGRWKGEVGAVMGEMQFAFIAFVYGQSLQGFHQWRSLVTLFLNCEAAALGGGRHAATFATFLGALRAQLACALADTADSGGLEGKDDLVAAATHGSSSLLVEEVLLAGGGRDCFLRHHLATWFEMMREAEPGEVDGRLQQEAIQLRSLLSRTLGWQFDGIEVLGENEDDEYAPVVVELGLGDMSDGEG